jgi:hypothetical protein
VRPKEYIQDIQAFAYLCSANVWEDVFPKTQGALLPEPVESSYSNHSQKENKLFALLMSCTAFAAFAKAAPSNTSSSHGW